MGGRGGIGRLLGAALAALAALAVVPSVVTAAPHRMAALGDSITVAFTGGSDEPSWSWATNVDGTNPVVSHVERLRAGPSPALEFVNLSVDGVRIADVADAQVPVATAAAPDYATLLIGTNDACHSPMTSVTSFRAAADSVLDRLLAIPGARLMLGSIPDWRRIFDGLPAPQQSLSRGRCANVTATAFPDRVLAFNDQLAASCAAHRGCFWDGGAVFAGFGLTVADLSDADFFHPSLLGQARIADLTWAHGPWEADAPTGGSLSFPTGATQETSATLAFAVGQDAGTGVAGWRLERAVAPALAGLCGAFGAWAQVGPAQPSSPYVDGGLPSASCVRWQLVVTDRAGNTAGYGDPAASLAVAPTPGPGPAAPTPPAASPTTSITTTAASSREFPVTAFQVTPIANDRLQVRLRVVRPARVAVRVQRIVRTGATGPRRLRPVGNLTLGALKPGITVKRVRRRAGGRALSDGAYRFTLAELDGRRVLTGPARTVVIPPTQRTGRGRRR